MADDVRQYVIFNTQLLSTRLQNSFMPSVPVTAMHSSENFYVLCGVTVFGLHTLPHGLVVFPLAVS